MAEEKNGLAVAGLVLGIVSAVFTFIFPPIGLITGIIGIFISANARKNPAKKGFASAGLALSIIGTVMSGIFFAICTLGCVYAYEVLQ